MVPSEFSPAIRFPYTGADMVGHLAQDPNSMLAVFATGDGLKVAQPIVGLNAVQVVDFVILRNGAIEALPDQSMNRNVLLGPPHRTFLVSAPVTELQIRRVRSIVPHSPQVRDLISIFVSKGRNPTLFQGQISITADTATNTFGRLMKGLIKWQS